MQDRRSVSIPSPAAAAATAEAATARSASPLLLLAGHIDREGAPTEVAPVQGRDRPLGLFLAGHVHKGEAARASSVSICDDIDFKYLAPTFLEERAELLFIHAEGEISHVHFRSHASFSFSRYRSPVLH
jgi:hypothetical protein